MGWENVYGVQPVREVLRCGRRRCRSLLVARSPKDAAVGEILALARKGGVEVTFVSKEETERRAPGGNHQGLVLDAEEPRLLVLEEALGELDVDRRTIWMGLDGITDPHNLGAILRNAAALGAAAVLLPERRSAQLTPLVQKIASGAAEHVAVVTVVNLNQTIRRLKDVDFWVYGADAGGREVGQVRFAGPCFLLIGAEGEGLRRRTRELCDELVAIPQAPGTVASLNASCASAVLLYEVARKLSEEAS